MRVKFLALGNLQVSSADGTVSYTHEAGEVVDLPDAIAGQFIAQGIAVAVKTTPERATAPAGQTADRPRRARKKGGTA